MKTFTVVVLLPFYRVDSNTIACESAYANHLRFMLSKMSYTVDAILVHSPLMCEEKYQKNKNHLEHIDCQKENIFLMESVSENAPRYSYFIKAPFVVWPKIWQVIKRSYIVQASVSDDILRPFGIVGLIFSVIQKKKTILVVDIDNRNSPTMLYKTGSYTYKNFFVNQYIYNPLISLQLSWAAKYCGLLILKGRSLAEDYGKGKKHVKNFLNTVHEPSLVISEEGLHKKIANYANKKTIDVVYFGRVIDYKGIDYMIEAVELLMQQLEKSGSQKTVRFSIIGAGDKQESLKTLVKQKGLEDNVIFYGAVPYGDELFNKIKENDFLLAAPKREDTPRSVFDAMACGVPIIAYDTYYYKDLKYSKAVETVPWLSPESMAEKIKDISEDYGKVSDMMKAAREFALDNTQSKWLDRRVEWTKEFLS